MENLSSFTSILNTLFLIAAMVGGYMAIRSGKHRASGEIQAQAIDALKAELDVLQRRLEQLEKENTRLNQIMSLIKSAMSKRGLVVTIDGDLVTIQDGHGGSQVGRIQEAGK